MRSRRARVPGTVAAAQTTTGVIGLGAALIGSTLGSLGASHFLGSTNAHPLLSVPTQIAAALVVSWVTAHIYGRYLANPVFTWFAGKEERTHGR
jgi:hypothetical protein